jgi:hypothetical protein
LHEDRLTPAATSKTGRVKIVKGFFFNALKLRYNNPNFATQNLCPARKCWLVFLSAWLMPPTTAHN